MKNAINIVNWIGILLAPVWIALFFMDNDQWYWWSDVDLAFIMTYWILTVIERVKSKKS